MRRSIRSFTSEAVPLFNVGQLLWAATGHNIHKRTAPSAGGIYPITHYVIARNVRDLPQGLYSYSVLAHGLHEEELGEYKVQDQVVGPLDIILNGDFGPMQEKYGERGIRYVWMEAGHCAQNILLQATALGMGAVVIGAFRDQRIKDILDLPGIPLYIVIAGNI